MTDPTDSASGNNPTTETTTTTTTTKSGSSSTSITHHPLSSPSPSPSTPSSIPHQSQTDFLTVRKETTAETKTTTFEPSSGNENKGNLVATSAPTNSNEDQQAATSKPKENNNVDNIKKIHEATSKPIAESEETSKVESQISNRKDKDTDLGEPATTTTTTVTTATSLSNPPVRIPPPPPSKTTTTPSSPPGPLTMADGPVVSKCVQSTISLLQRYGPLTLAQIEFNIPPMEGERVRHTQVADVVDVLVALGMIQIHPLSSSSLDDISSSSLPTKKYCIQKGHLRRGALTSPSSIMNEIIKTQGEWKRSQKRQDALIQALKQKSTSISTSTSTSSTTALAATIQTQSANNPPTTSEQRPRDVVQALLVEYPEIALDPVYIAAMRNLNVDVGVLWGGTEASLASKTAGSAIKGKQQSSSSNGGVGGDPKKKRKRKRPNTENNTEKATKTMKSTAEATVAMLNNTTSSTIPVPNPVTTAGAGGPTTAAKPTIDKAGAPPTPVMNTTTTGTTAKPAIAPNHTPSKDDAPPNASMKNTTTATTAMVSTSSRAPVTTSAKDSTTVTKQPIKTDAKAITSASISKASITSSAKDSTTVTKQPIKTKDADTQAITGPSTSKNTAMTKNDKTTVTKPEVDTTNLPQG